MVAAAPCRQSGRSMLHVRPPCLGLPGLSISILVAGCFLGQLRPVAAAASGFDHQDLRAEDVTWPQGSLVRRHEAAPQQLPGGRVFAAPQRQRGFAANEDLMVPLADAAAQRRMVATIAPAGFFEVERQPISLGATNLTAASSAGVPGSALATLQTKVVDTTAIPLAATTTQAGASTTVAAPTTATGASTVPAPSTVAAPATAATTVAAPAPSATVAAAAAAAVAAATTAAVTTTVPGVTTIAAVASGATPGAATSVVTTVGIAAASGAAGSTTTGGANETDSGINGKRALKSIGMGAGITVVFLLIVYVIVQFCGKSDSRDTSQQENKRPKSEPSGAEPRAKPNYADDKKREDNTPKVPQKTNNSEEF